MIVHKVYILFYKSSPKIDQLDEKQRKKLLIKYHCKNVGIYRTLDELQQATVRLELEH